MKTQKTIVRTGEVSYMLGISCDSVRLLDILKIVPAASVSEVGGRRRWNRADIVDFKKNRNARLVEAVQAGKCEWRTAKLLGLDPDCDEAKVLVEEPAVEVTNIAVEPFDPQPAVEFTFKYESVTSQDERAQTLAGVRSLLTELRGQVAVLTAVEKLLG